MPLMGLNWRNAIDEKMKKGEIVFLRIFSRQSKGLW
jgi:hypothetical protein